MTTTTTEQMQLLKHTCTICREQKSWSDFYAKVKWDDGTMRRPQSRCRKCDAAYLAERRKAGLVDRDAERERLRAYRAKIAADPDLLAEHRRKRAEYKATWRAKQRGRAPRRDPRQPVEHEDDTRLPVEPLAAWIRDQLARDPEITGVRIAAWFDIDESLLRSWLHGHVKTVDIDRIDQALTRLGLPHLMNELWPIDDQETAAA